MKTIRIKAYTAQELKDKFPRAFERAYDDYKQSVYEMGTSWGDEIIDSLKAIFESTDGIYLKDWSIDADNRRNYVKISFSQDEAEDLQGARAQAWLENNLLYKLRIGYNAANRWELSKYGQFYRAGMIESCSFTGVCFDEDFLESLQKDIKAGCTIGEAFHNLADEAGRLLEAELDSQLSEEYFIDMSSANEWFYEEDGDQI